MGNKPTRHFSNAQENAVAKALNGRTTPNSGATPFFKGDVVAGSFLIECKTCETQKKSFSIKQEWLEAIERERVETRKGYCALAFSFGPGQPNHYVVDEYTFKAMLDALAKAEGK